VMSGEIIVMEPTQYQAWLTGGNAVSEANSSGGLTGPTVSAAAAGERLFNQLGCANCHLPNGSGRGPSLAGLYGREVKLEGGQTLVADETYIRDSILNPNRQVVAGYQPIMPSYQGQLSEEQLVDLIAYVKSLSGR
jgi:cytochrome c oxidase subunit II